MALEKIFKMLSKLFIILLFSWWVLITNMPGRYLVMVSVSSDGKYVLTSGYLENFKIELWDIEQKKKQVISYAGNYFSPYFIKNSHNFIWQDKNDIVHVQNTDGKELLKFHHFPVYGQVMTTDLQHYFSVDNQWNLYSGYGAQKKLIKSAYSKDGYATTMKLLNLTLSNDNKYLLTSGKGNIVYDEIPIATGNSTTDVKNTSYYRASMSVDPESLFEGVVLWDVASSKPIRKFPGPSLNTIATLSPDGNTVVAGDFEQRLYIWNAKTGERYDAVNPPSSDKIPIDVNSSRLLSHDHHVFAVKFIDLQDDYLRFTLELYNYALLYNAHVPTVIKWLHLTPYPNPATDDYDRMQSIDSAPAAHILVTSQENLPGIIVYRYHPDTQKLEKIWVPYGNFWRVLTLFIQGFIIGLLIWRMIAKKKYAVIWLTTIITIILSAIIMIGIYFQAWGVIIVLAGLCTAPLILYSRG